MFISRHGVKVIPERKRRRKFEDDGPDGRNKQTEIDKML